MARARMRREIEKELEHHEEEALGKAYDARLVRRLWPFVAPQKGLLALSLALLPVVTALELAQPYLVKVAIDAHIAPGRLEGLGGIAALFLAALLGQFVFAFLDMYLMQLIGQRVVRDIRGALYAHVQGRATRFFDKNPVGRLVVRVTNDPEVVNEMFAAGVIALAGDLVKLLGIVAAMLWIDWRLTLAALVVLPPLVGIAMLFRALVRDAYRLVRIKIAQVNAFMAESLSGMRVIQLFAREERNFRDFDRVNREHMESNFLQIRYDALLFAIVELLSSLSVALLLWYGGGRLLQGAVSFGVLVAFIEYMGKFFVPIRDLSAKYTVMQSAMASCERIFQILDAGDRIAAPERPAKVERFRGAIEFDSVTFGYDPARPVLRKISLAIAPGEKIAVVGATGSGKTTLIKLLSRLYDPDEGAVRIDGIDLRDLDPRDLRRRIGVVLQDVFLFKGTVASNIGLGLEEKDRARIEAAARAIGAERFIERRRSGFDEPVSAQGANFGAGERQLISFARALAHDPDVLVLDEATSNIDAVTEQTIQRGIVKLMEGRTSIVVAHRLSTIRRADRIVVLHKGEIREIGSHEELLALGGVYARLYELQYKDGAAQAP